MLTNNVVATIDINTHTNPIQKIQTEIKKIPTEIKKIPGKRNFLTMHYSIMEPNQNSGTDSERYLSRSTMPNF